MLSLPISNSVEPEGWLAATHASFRRETRRALAHTAAHELLREAGYRTVYIPSQITHVQIDGWDETIASGHVNDFELTLIEQSRLAGMLAGWALDQQRLT